MPRTGSKNVNLFLLTPLREGRPPRGGKSNPLSPYFYSRPCGRGDTISQSVTALLGAFLLTPLREGRRTALVPTFGRQHFYSRPCGRGDRFGTQASFAMEIYFYSRPCGRGDLDLERVPAHDRDFYSRPCGRGDQHDFCGRGEEWKFLLTPLREGRHTSKENLKFSAKISTHAPAGGATQKHTCFFGSYAISTHAPAGGATMACSFAFTIAFAFLLTPLREGRQSAGCFCLLSISQFLLTPLREGRPSSQRI